MVMHQPEYHAEPEHMRRISMVILRPEQEVRVCEGCPQDYGVDEADLYVEFVYSRLLVTVWLTGDLEPYERRRISHQILEYVRDRSVVM